MIGSTPIGGDLSMKNLKHLPLMFCTAIVVACIHVSVLGQAMEDKNKLATINGMGSSVRWDVAAPYSALTMTVTAPDGRVFRSVFKGGVAPEFTITDRQGGRLPDGSYTYELRLTPALSQAVKQELAATRGKDDDPEDVRATRKRVVLPVMVQSGAFAIVNGALVVAGATEDSVRRISQTTERSPAISSGAIATKNLQHHPLMIMKPDDVIPDDLIVQGSACVGLDCVNGEVFGFDTIRLKENNTRLQFDDTSVGSFPTNNWQIRANSSANGGASFLSFVDQGASGTSETGTIVFEVDAGAPANALKVSSTGRVGLRTATPALDLHITTGDTPAHRLEQTNASGFTAQTWDVAGNEANFFVRDVTGGSRLPFRIRPGAPTSSIDISASGDVGIGTASPLAKLHVFSTATTDAFGGFGPDPAAGPALNFGYAGSSIGRGAAFFNVRPDAGAAAPNPSLRFLTVNVERMIITNQGNVGIGTSAPTETLSVNGTASKTGGGTWAVFSDERLKNIKGPFSSGLKAVMQLQPLRYEYKENNSLGLKSAGEHIGFGAQSLQKVIPEAVSKNSNGYLMVNSDPILWTMLNAIKEQQKEIEQLKGQIRKLQTASRRRK
jgi:hypothetical protein